MSQSLEQILENAHALYQQCVAQQMAEDRKRWAEEEKRLDRERAELREWLVQFIPSELMQYVDTSDYDHSVARQQGVLEVHVPGAAPICFSVRRVDSDFYGIGNSGDYTDYPVFRAPNWWDAILDEENRPYIQYRSDDFRSQDFQLVLGAAVDFWREHGADIESALAQKGAERRIAEAAVSVKREGLSLDERQVLALETIADALVMMSYNSNC